MLHYHDLSRLATRCALCLVTTFPSTPSRRVKVFNRAARGPYMCDGVRTTLDLMNQLNQLPCQVLRKICREYAPHMGDPSL